MAYSNEFVNDDVSPRVFPEPYLTKPTIFESHILSREALIKLWTSNEGPSIEIMDYPVDAWIHSIAVNKNEEYLKSEDNKLIYYLIPAQIDRVKFPDETFAQKTNDKGEKTYINTISLLPEMENKIPDHSYRISSGELRQQYEIYGISHVISNLCKVANYKMTQNHSIELAKILHPLLKIEYEVCSSERILYFLSHLDEILTPQEKTLAINVLEQSKGLVYERNEFSKYKYSISEEIEYLGSLINYVNEDGRSCTEDVDRKYIQCAIEAAVEIQFSGNVEFDDIYSKFEHYLSLLDNKDIPFDSRILNMNYFVKFLTQYKQEIYNYNDDVRSKYKMPPLDMHIEKWRERGFKPKDMNSKYNKHRSNRILF